MDIKYCYEKCEKGRTTAKDLIWRCESMFDAAFDFECFCKDCFITCPFKDFHQEATND
jgi:hypothetical protein